MPAPFFFTSQNDCSLSFPLSLSLSLSSPSLSLSFFHIELHTYIYLMAVNLYGFVTSWFQFLTQECCSHFFWGPGLASRWSSRASLWGVEPRQSCAILIGGGGGEKCLLGIYLCVYIYICVFFNL